MKLFLSFRWAWVCKNKMWPQRKEKLESINQTTNVFILVLKHTILQKISKSNRRLCRVFRVELQYSYLRAQPQLEKSFMNFDRFLLWILNNKDDKVIGTIFSKFKDSKQKNRNKKNVFFQRF